jgi:hypothetical protein
MDCGSRHRGMRAPRVLNPEVLDSGRRATNVDRPGPIDLISGVIPVAYAQGDAVDAPSTPQLGSPTTLLTSGRRLRCREHRVLGTQA